MQKFTTIFTLGLLLIFGLAISNLASDKYDPEELGFESVEETSKPLGIIKHPGTNDFSLLWDNFASGDTIADDVSGLTVTDASNDLDGDGFAEIICSDEDGFTYVFENTGNDSFDLVWKMEVVTSPGGHAYAPVVIADLDGDGLQEIVATFEDSAGIYFYEWDGVVGSDNYTEVAFLDVPYDDYDNTRTMTIDNLDSDINQELIIAQGDTCYVIEADVSFNFNIEAKMWGALLDEVHSVITADLNNNGSKEVIYCDWNYSAIHIWENTAEDTYVNVLPDNNGIMLDDEDGRAYEMIITNFDGDSYPEIFAVTSTEKLIVFEMQSSSWDTSASNMMSNILLINGSDDIKGISTGDVDEDGNPDLYFVTDDMHVYDYEYMGGDIFDPLNYTLYDIGQLNGADAEKIAYAGDMDGDGELEIVVGYEGSPDYPLLYFLEHYVAPAIPIAELNRTDFLFDHVWNLAEVDTELVILRNIGASDLTVDSIVSSDPVFTSFMANATVPALGGSEVIELYFTALDQAIHDSSYYIIYSNSNTSPDTVNVYGDSREMPALFINEFQPDATEWVELYNEGAATVDLTDIGITDGRNSYSPANLFGTPVWGSIEYFSEDADWGPTQTLAAGAYLVSYTTEVSLAENQEWAYLVYRDSTILQRIAYGGVGGAPFYHFPGGDSITGGSMSRVANTGNLATDWTVDFDATPGLPNDAVPPDLGSSIIINEVDYDGDIVPGFEHVEFFNPTASDIQMFGWKLTYDDDLFVMDSLLVPAGGVAVFADSNLSIAVSFVTYLYNNNDVRVDQVGYISFNPTEKLNGTLQRIPDGAGPNDGYDYWTTGGDVTWFDRAHTLGSLNVVIPTTYVIFTAKVGGDANYRSFWVNGSWDSTGVPDPNWTGPMIELINDGVTWPDTSATDSIFSGVVQLFADSTYDWWVGSENQLGSFLEDGAAITPDTSTFNYSTTCIVDPGDAGFTQWTIGAAGDSINGWNNAEDNLTRSGWEWSGNFTLSAGPMEFKFVVMHSWIATYGDGGIGAAGVNYQYTVPTAGDYTITFNDSTDTYTIEEYISRPRIIYEDDFEAYAAGTALTVQNSTDWITWSGTPGTAEDPIISTTYANSGVNSVNVISNNDFVKVMPNYTVGIYKMSFDLYIPTGTVAYFNTLQEFSPTPTWGMQVYFRERGNADMDADGATSATFNYTYNTWLHNEIIVNLDSDTAEYYVDGVRIHGWKWSAGSFGTNNLNQLGGNNFFGGGPTGTFDFYIDDYELKRIPPSIFTDDFDSYTAGTQLVVQNPTDWDTWSGGGGTAEDPYITDAQALSVPNSMLIDEDVDLIAPLGEKTSGVYSMSWQSYIPSGKTGYFAVMNRFYTADEKGIRVYYNDDGTGDLRFDYGGTIIASFTYTQDAWQDLEVVVDLDQSLAEVHINGASIYQWDWTRGGAVSNQLDVIDFWGRVSTDEMYIDDYVIVATDEIVSSIDNKLPEIPISYNLEQNFPNPFNPTTTIRFQIPKKAYVKIVIYNVLGQVVRTVVDKSIDAGYHDIVWDGLNETGVRVATGIYFYRMQTDKFVKSHKMIMMK